MDLREHFLPRHVLAQVVAEGLPAVGRFPILKVATGTLNNCISSTRIAKMVCDHYGIPSRPVPCQVLVWNRAAQDRSEREGKFLLPETRAEREAWEAEDGTYARAVGWGDIPTNADSWPGHLVLVVNEEWIVDLSMDQGMDPRHGLAPEPLTFPAHPFLDGEFYPLWHAGSGTGIGYLYAPDKPPFEDSPAWSWPEPHFPAVVAEIVSELDGLDPQTVIRSSVWAK
ncbi:MAG: hypothetical protein QOF36_2502 [Microbacteriaceae bacterium]|jgi:hypothetical protein|nr:hypothetical protein [Microbacteriaceae bacterium]